MAFLNLQRTAGTDLVTPVGALDNNWDQIDTNFALIDAKAGAVGTGVTPETGMEFVASQQTPPSIGVWDGAAYDFIITSETWGAWTNINLAANFNPVTGRTPQIRVSNMGHVQCRGAVQYLTGTTAWPAGYQTVNSGQFASATYLSSASVVRNLMASITGTTTWAYGQAFINVTSGFISIFLIYMGTTLASNNLISLDNLSWYV
jgi:hypothetical protein